jgi:hypothetical protein
MQSRTPVPKALAFLALAAMLTLGARPASAATITQFVVGPILPTPWTLQTAQLNQFDPALGTLTGVQFQLIGKATTEFTLNVDNTAGNFGYEKVGATVQATLGNVVVSLLDLSSPRAFVWPSGYCDSQQKPVPCTIAANYAETATMLDVIDPVAWGSFTGTGKVGVDMNANPVRIGQFGSGFEIEVDVTKASAEGALTYTYDPVSVPEPGLLALALTGLAGLGVARRRRNS